MKQLFIACTLIAKRRERISDPYLTLGFVMLMQCDLCGAALYFGGCSGALNSSSGMQESN